MNKKETIDAPYTVLDKYKEIDETAREVKEILGDDLSVEAVSFLDDDLRQRIIELMQLKN
jgi:hypothetical protein